MAASGKPPNGELHPKPDIISFSLGEKAGMRASVFSTASFRFRLGRKIPNGAVFSNFFCFFLSCQSVSR